MVLFLILFAFYYFLYDNLFNKKEQNRINSFIQKIIDKKDNFITNDCLNDKLNRYLVDIDNENTFIEKYRQFDINEEIDIIIDCYGGKISSSDAIMNILLMQKEL